MKTALTFVIVLAAACGGGKSKPAESMDSKQMAMGEHEAMPPEIAKFHDVMAPRWHAEKGPQRMTDTCTAVPEMQTDADAIAKATPPAGADATRWSTGAKELTDAIVALDGTCKANDATAFEPAFERVHNAFHATMEAAGGHHEGMEHEGMEHEGMEHEGMEHGDHTM